MNIAKVRKIYKNIDLVYFFDKENDITFRVEMSDISGTVRRNSYVEYEIYYDDDFGCKRIRNCKVI